MPRLLQFIAVLLVLLGLRPARAFSLLGPVAPAPGAEAWQTPQLGYDPLLTDIGAPKNFGEEYRWNVPIITYGFDSSFINYFGSQGVTAIDEAFAILNSLPDLSTISQNLDEYPLNDPNTGSFTTFRDSRQVNLRAQADNIVDMKSAALGLIVEELGLASPSRWTWALRDRKIVGNPPVTNYLTIQRNFDPVTLRPSKYVNGTRYTYNILEFAAPVAFADAVEQPVDPEQAVHSFDAVADIAGNDIQNGLAVGVFYTYLTRDDIGGLRYIYSTNNLHYEPFPPNTQVFAADRTQLVLVTNHDLTLFSLTSLTSSPQQLSNLYPGLNISEVIATPTTVLTNVPLIITQTVTVAFQTNLAAPVIVSNLDLGTFSSVTLTSAPANLVANLQAAFPGVQGFDQLVIQSTNAFPTTVVQVASVFLTNNFKQPWNDPFSTSLFLATNYVTNAAIGYLYSFRNVITNNFSPLSFLRRIVVGVQKEPWSDPFNPVFKTNVQDVVIQRPSGGVIIVPTNLLTYQFTAFNVTNVIGITNFFVSTNVVDLFSGITHTVSETDLTLFTNVQFFAYPVEILPQAIQTNIIITNGFVTTNIIFFSYKYANVITNYFGPNTPGVEIRYQVVTNALNPFFLQTNIISASPVVLPVPSGGFMIDTNLTGFEFVGVFSSNIISATNIVFDVTDPTTGLRTVDEIVYNFTNTVYLAFPFILTNAPPSVLRPGVGKLHFQRIGGTFNGSSFLFTNRYQATYITNGLLVTNTFVNVQTQPDFLFRAADLGTFASDVEPIQYRRSPNFQNNAASNSTEPSQGGPGTILPTVNIDFNKVGPSIVNEFPGFINEASGLEFFTLQPFVWGRFDGTTNTPIVFPNTISLQDIEFRKTGGAVP